MYGALMEKYKILHSVNDKYATVSMFQLTGKFSNGGTFSKTIQAVGVD